MNHNCDLRDKESIICDIYIEFDPIRKKAEIEFDPTRKKVK